MKKIRALCPTLGFLVAATCVVAVTRSWTPGAQLLAARLGCAAALLAPLVVLIAGGRR